MGDAKQAIGYYEQALVISREIGDRRGEGIGLGGLGSAHRALGDVERAIAYYEQALAISREIGDRGGEGNHLANLGLAYRALGEGERAKACWQETLMIYEAIESPYVGAVRGLLEEAAGS